MKFFIESILLLSLSLLIVSCASLSRVMMLETLQDKIPIMKTRAEGLQSGEIIPNKIIPLETSDVDEIVPVSGKGILIGTTILGSGSGFDIGPSYGPFTMYDEDMQKILWSFERNGSYTSKWEVLVTKPVVLLYHSDSTFTEYICLNIEDGSKKWHYATEEANSFSIDDESKVILITEKVEGILKFKLVDFIDGAERWFKTYEDLDNNSSFPKVLIGEKKIFLIGTNAKCLSLIDGSVIWQLTDIGPVSIESIVLKHSNGLIIPSERAVITSVSLEGIILWKTNIDSSCGIITSDNIHIYVKTNTFKNKNDKILCYSISNGQLIWSKSLDGEIVSQLLVTEETLCFSLRHADGEERIEAWDIVSGKEKFSTTVPWNRSEESFLLPNQLVAIPEIVVVTSEKGVAAFQISNGQNLWYHLIRGEEYSYQSRVDKLKNTYLTLGWTGSDQSMKNSVFSYNSHWADRSQNMALAQAQRNYEITMSSSKDPFQRSIAISSLQTQIKIQQEMERAATTMDFYFAVLNLSNQIYESRVKLARQALITAALSQIQQSRKINSYQVQGTYFVRPFRHRDIGIGFFIVDIRNGNWQETITSVAENSSYRYLLNNCIPILTSDGKHLIVNGTGLDTEKWKPVLANYKDQVVGQSILVYDLNKLKLKPFSKFDPLRKYGYINNVGKFSIEPRFDRAMQFHEGFARVMDQGKWGFIEKTGEWVIPPKYVDAKDFSEGLAFVKINGKWGAVDPNGEIVCEPVYNQANNFSEGLAAVLIDGKWGFIDKKGTLVIHPQFEIAESFNNGRAKILQNDKFGYINIEGQVVIPAEFPSAESFSEGMAAVNVEEEWGVIDTTGTFLVEPDFNELKSFNNGLAPFRTVEIMHLRPVWGFLNKNGDEIISADFQYVSNFINGYSLIQKDDMWGYISTDGSFLIPPIIPPGDFFTMNESMHFYGYYDNLALSTSKGLYGYINEKGNFSIPPQFLEADHFAEGLAAVRLKK